MGEAVSLLMVLYGLLAVWGLVALLQKLGVIEIVHNEPDSTREGQGPMRW